MSSDVNLREFLQGFVAEAEEHLRSCRENFLELDEVARDGRAAPREVRELYRALHTIKGLAAMVGVQPVVDLAHQMETVVREADRAGGLLGPAALDPLADGIEALEKRIRAVGRGEQVLPAPRAVLAALEEVEPSARADATMRGVRLSLPAELADKLTAAERQQIVEGVRAGKRALRAEFLPSPERAEAGLTITTVRERVGALGDIVRVLPRSVAREQAAAGLAFVLLILTEADDEAVAEAAGADGVEPLVEVDAAVGVDLSSEPARDEIVSRGIVRVDVARLDGAMQRLSALVVSGFRLSRAVAAMDARGVDVRELRVVLEEHARYLRDMRESILSMRMVRVAEVLEPIPLIVRGLRSTTGKAVRVEIDAARAELDKGVAERIFPAVVHLVRNAVDHGIEPAEERRAAGKPEEGLLRIVAGEVSGGRLELRVSDDGRGIDPRAVARAAGAPVPADEQGLLDLLTRPGLSTRTEADATSGRGMGMEIVHRIVVEQLGGELGLELVRGAGATFVLRIPLTVSIMDTLGFTCAEQSFVTPLGTVDEILDLSDVDLVETPSPATRSAGLKILERRGAAIPYMPLANLFAVCGASTPRKALVVCRDNERWAFGVDRMLGQQEVVVRPLEDPLVRVPGVAGATDLGDGKPTLVIDLLALGVSRATAREVVR